jgi:uncharacterized membrane protein
VQASKLKKAFLHGAILVMPLLVTWFLLSFVLDRVNASVAPWLRGISGFMARWVPALDPSEPWMRVAIPVLGVVLVLSFILLVGLMGSHLVGKRLIHRFEEWILTIPVIKGIYGGTRQVFETFKAGDVRAFERVVVVEFPRPGMFMLGFVTRRVATAVQQRLGVSGYAHVFVPTTPNPTSGLLFLVREDELIDTGMSVEEGVKAIVSGGMLVGETRPSVGTAPEVREGATTPSPVHAGK